MELFDDFSRSDRRPASHAEPIFSFLNRSAFEQFENARSSLECWFSSYPDSYKSDLRSRIRSEDDDNHQGACFELFLHQMLLSLTCGVQVHPAIPATSKSPDFLATPTSDHPFFLEATLATYKSAAEAASDARTNTVYDTLNRKIKSRDFFLDLEVEGSPRTSPPGSKLAALINQQLNKLSPDEISHMFERGGLESLPKWRFSHDGWRIVIRPIPKKPESRGKRSLRPVGMIGTGVQAVDHRTPLRTALEEKSTAYGELHYPYVIAVNALENIDEIDIMEALFGREQWTFSLDDLKEDKEPNPQMTRLPDGLWTSRTGPRNTRVSAILLFRRFRPWNIRDTGVRLYHNPWAKRQYSSVLCSLPQAVPDGSRMVKMDGISIADVLNQ